MNENDAEAAMEAATLEAKALVVEAAVERGYHCAEDAWALIPDNSCITSAGSAKAAVGELARKSPWLTDPYQQPPPPPRAGTPGPHPKWRRLRPSADQQMFTMLTSGSRKHSGRRG